MLARFDQLAAEAGVELTLAELLPAIAVAGRPAGTLTEAGAALLDPTGRLRPGIPLCPPEGDAGTGMVATNSVAPRTGNVSAGTTIFAMVVLERELARVHRELDLVTTPAGDPVAMVHCNNGASELDAWAGLFAEFARALGAEVDPSKVFETLFTAALGGASDCGGMLAYNYLSGEPITDLEEGRPLFLRSPDSRLELGTFMRTHLFSSLATLRIGMDVLQKTEGVRLDRMFAHGGLFKTEGVAQRFLAAAIDTPVSVGDVAGEGGAWGIAVLAAFATGRSPEQSLADYLDTTVFTGASLQTVEPDPIDVAGFDAFMQRYVAALPVERAAVDHVGVGQRPPDRRHRDDLRRPDRGAAGMTATLTERGTHRAQREHVAALHAYLTRYELVTWTSGNVSERVPGEDLFVIKGSGVEYDELTWEGITVCDLDGNVVDGVKAPSSRHRRARLRLPEHARGQRAGAHAQPVRRRPGPRAARRSPACSPRWPTSSAARSRSARSR